MTFKEWRNAVSWSWPLTRYGCNLCGEPFNLLERLYLRPTIFHMIPDLSTDNRLCHPRCYIAVRSVTAASIIQGECKYGLFHSVEKYPGLGVHDAKESTS
jgi:hypothetical protein